jgi:hypothetical protein
MIISPSSSSSSVFVALHFAIELVLLRVKVIMEDKFRKLQHVLDLLASQQRGKVKVLRIGFILPSKYSRWLMLR